MTQTYNLVDADQHANPPPDFWQDYLPQKFRADAPRIEPGDDVDYVVFEGERKPFSLMAALAGHKPKDYKEFGRKSDTRIGGWDPEARCEDMDLDGIDAAVIYGGGPLRTRNLDLHIASFDAYNRWLADFCNQVPERLLGIAYLPMLEVHDAIERMRRAADLGLKGVTIPAFPQSKKSADAGAAGAASGGQALALQGDPFGPRSYCDAEFDPFWSASVDLGMPIHMHLGARAARVEPAHFLPDLVMSKLTMAEPIAIMVFGGVFQRHPQLKFVSVESGVGWFGFVASYMDKIWHKHRYWTGNRLEGPPSVYMNRNVYGTFLEDTAGVLLRDEPGARNIMWSSDYPHSETSWPESKQVIERTLGDLPAEDRQRIVCDTAKALYLSG